MAAHRTRSRALLVALVGTVAALVLLVAAYCGRGWIRDRWCLHRLRNGVDETTWLLVLGDSPNQELAWAAAEALARSHEVNEPVLALYARILRGPTEEVPGSFVEALGLLARSDQRVKELIRSALAARDAGGELALQAVGWMGPAGLDLVTEVEGLATASDRRLAKSAHDVLRELRPPDAELPAR